MRRLTAAVLSIIFLSSCASAARVPQVAQAATAPADVEATRWLGDVQAIAAAADNQGRRGAIADRLEALGLTARKVAFQANDKSGENLLVDVAGPADAPLLLLGAHSDRVEAGHGATDNASGSATVLALAQRFRERPLQHHRVAVAFWDLEEEGLLGSKAYVADGSVRPALYVNFDVFGWGDTLWMMVPANAQAELVDAGRAATQELKLGFSPGEQYPPTDHLPFIRAGWPAVSYSLVGRDEIDQVLAAYAGKKSRTPPKVMQVIHTELDTLGQVDAPAAARGVDAVERALRRWDAQVATAKSETGE